MKAKLFWLVLILGTLFLSGCLTDDPGQDVAKKEVVNVYATKRLLILTKTSDYRTKLIDRLTARLSKSYSFVIDDFNKVLDYNFTTFHKVLFLENTIGAHNPQVENYVAGYSGINNIILVAITTDQNYKPPVQGVDYLVCSPNVDNVNYTAELIIQKIRQK